MRMPDEERMKRDGHDSPRPRAVFIETIELIANHAAEGFAILFKVKKSRDVIDLNRIGDRQDGSILDAHQVWLLIIHPIRNVLNLVFGKQVQRAV